jgi:hypothetical protein
MVEACEKRELVLGCLLASTVTVVSEVSGFAL